MRELAIKIPLTPQIYAFYFFLLLFMRHFSHYIYYIIIFQIPLMRESTWGAKRRSQGTLWLGAADSLSCSYCFSQNEPRKKPFSPAIFQVQFVPYETNSSRI